MCVGEARAWHASAAGAVKVPSRACHGDDCRRQALAEGLKRKAPAAAAGGEAGPSSSRGKAGAGGAGPPAKKSKFLDLGLDDDDDEEEDSSDDEGEEKGEGAEDDA